MMNNRIQSFSKFTKLNESIADVTGSVEAKEYKVKDKHKAEDRLGELGIEWNDLGVGYQVGAILMDCVKVAFMALLPIGLGMKLDQKNILAGHSRKMRGAKDLAKQLVAR